jgi:hypothetical protein
MPDTSAMTHLSLMKRLRHWRLGLFGAGLVLQCCMIALPFNAGPVDFGIPECQYFQYLGVMWLASLVASLTGLLLPSDRLPAAFFLLPGLLLPLQLLELPLLLLAMDCSPWPSWG